jgi:hypothetical protein
MKRMLLLSIVIALLVSASGYAQTVYFNHSKGVTLTLNGTTQVAKLTIPSGTYHAFSKIGFSGDVSGNNPTVTCTMWVTGIPNVAYLRC